MRVAAGGGVSGVSAGTRRMVATLHGPSSLERPIGLRRATAMFQSAGFEARRWFTETAVAGFGPVSLVREAQRQVMLAAAFRGGALLGVRGLVVEIFAIRELIIRLAHVGRGVAVTIGAVNVQAVPGGSP